MSTVENFTEAPEVKRIATKLIPKYHGHLSNVHIEYVFRAEHSKDKGKPVAGKARKISGLNAFLSNSEDEYFVIEIAKDIWDGMPERARTALVDHELMHCFWYVDDEGKTKLSLLPHDLEEFGHIVERHGLWSRDIELFLERAKGQLSLLADNVHTLPTKGPDDDAVAEG